METDCAEVWHHLVVCTGASLKRIVATLRGRSAQCSFTSLRPQLATGEHQQADRHCRYTAGRLSYNQVQQLNSRLISPWYDDMGGHLKQEWLGHLSHGPSIHSSWSKSQGKQFRRRTDARRCSSSTLSPSWWKSQSVFSFMSCQRLSHCRSWLHWTWIFFWSCFSLRFW